MDSITVRRPSASTLLDQRARTRLGTPTALITVYLASLSHPAAAQTAPAPQDLPAVVVPAPAEPKRPAVHRTPVPARVATSAPAKRRVSAPAPRPRSPVPVAPVQAQRSTVPTGAHQTIGTTSTVGAPPPAFAGGQVATGGRVGFLGNKSVFDTPFTQNNYTEKLIRDQQANTVSDVLANDPAVRQTESAFAPQENVYNRGVLINARDFAFDGLYGITNIFNTPVTGVERVEVLNGPAAFLYGFSPAGNVGGVVNLVPKRATDDPITRVTGQYLSNTTGGGTFDIGRRFGDGGAFGIRANGSYVDGGTPIDHQSQQLGVGTLGLDYRGERLRFSIDLDYDHFDDKASTFSFSVLPGFAIPQAPRLSTNLAQPWERLVGFHDFAVGRAEYDLTDNVTVFGAIGGADLQYTNIGTFPTITDRFGTLSQQLNYITPNDQFQWSGEGGVRGKFVTGPVDHSAAVVGTHYDNSEDFGYTFGDSFTSNLYNPVTVPRPPVDINAHLPLDLEHNIFDSVAVTDTLSILDERVQLIAGGRFLRVQSTDYDQQRLVLDAYDKSAATPAAALLVKPWKPLTLYVSYAEGFGFGPVAPPESVNAGQIFPPSVTQQIETGAKLNYGSVGATLAFFKIDQPSAFLDPATKVYNVTGEQVNQGVDLNVFGEPVSGVRVLGGITLLDGTLTKTAGGIYDGKTAPGVPTTQLNIGGEYDVPPALLRGLTLTGRVTYTSKQYYDQANTQSIPDWAKLDLGARYTFAGYHGQPVVARFNVENVTGNNYWSSTGDGGLSLGTPRTYRLSLQMDF